MAGMRIPEQDGELIRRAQEGQREAFGRLVERHMRRAYTSALGFVGSHDRALDLSQEAFVRAYGARQRIDPTRPFFPWLYQILRRLCLNALRDERSRGAKLSLEAALVAPAGALDPADAAERAELRDRCRRAIEELPETEREVLLLRVYQGLKYSEIADLVAIPIGTVMSRLYSARRRLATLMDGDR